MIRRLTWILFVAVITFAAFAVLSGCGTTTPPVPSDGIEVRDGVQTIHPKLPDGRTVTCVLWSGYTKGGLSCDWAGAK